MAGTDRVAQSIVERRRDVRTQFSQNFARLIDERGMKQSTLAARVDEIFREDKVYADPDKPQDGFREIRPWEISRWSRGLITPDPVAITSIAKAFDVEPDDLVHGITAESDPNAVTFKTQQLPNGRYFWTFSGSVDAGTHRKLLSALADADPE